MHHDVHKAALRAAAKVALSASLLGCGSTSELAEEEAQEPTSVESPVAAAGRAADLGGRRRHSGASCSNDAGPAPVCGGSDRIQCCTAHVRDFVASRDAGSWFGVDPASVSADTKACCTSLQSHFDAKLDAGGWDAFDWGGNAEIRGFCCFGISSEFSGTCTPWGPPVPPASRPRSRNRTAGVA